MFTLYLFALLVGGGLLLFSFFGSHDSHDFGHDADAGNPVQWLSLRTLIYFLFVFGGVGAVLSKTWHWAAAPIVFALAVAAGVTIGAAVSWIFGYLRRTDSGVRDTDDSFVGLPARVTLPIAAGGMGKVLVQRGDRTYELLARSLSTNTPQSASWTNVIVVSMDKGTALVTTRDDPAVKELVMLLNPSQE